MRVDENEMSVRWKNKANWLVLESGLRRYQSRDGSWCPYVKPDLKLRGIPAASTIRPTSALRTIVIIVSQKEQQGLAGPARLSFLYFRPGPRAARPVQGSTTHYTTAPPNYNDIQYDVVSYPSSAHL